jgi:4-amino-4-deoxy-L-arabinose transferase-like glycosyltransferase
VTGTPRQEPVAGTPRQLPVTGRSRQDAAAAVLPPVPALAWRPVLAIAGGTGAVLLATSAGYGYFGDELYFLATGRHPSWGYADQPPLLPLLARAIDMVFPGSVVALRFPAVAMMVAGVVVAALIARELGGSSRAQVLTAAAYAIPVNLTLTRMLSTASVDLLLWTLASWLVIRWVRLHRDRLLLYAGLVTAVALQAKYLMVAFWVVVAVSALLAGSRELLRRPMLWLGWLVAGAAAVPSLLWQAGHGWPQLDMTAAVAADQEYFVGGRPSFLALAVLGAGVPVGAVLFCYGLWRLLRSPDLRPYRFLGWTTVGLIVIFLIADGHNYYIAGLYAVSWAAGAVELERRAVPRLTWLPTWPAYLVSAVLVVAVALPVRPVWTLGPTDPGLRGSVGWPAFADTVSTVYRSLRW